MEAIALGAGTATARTVGSFESNDHIGTSLQGEVQSLLSLRSRCCELGEEGTTTEAIEEQIAIRRLLLARLQELRVRIMHTRFAGLNIIPLRPRRRSPRDR